MAREKKLICPVAKWKLLIGVAAAPAVLHGATLLFSEVIGGPGKEFWSNGRNKECRFLTVLQTADKEAKSWTSRPNTVPFQEENRK